MRKQKESLGQSDSRKRVKTVFEQEQALSKAFQISNFYTDQRLNIAQLKQRLQLFKNKQKHQPQQQVHYTPQRVNNAIFNQPLPLEMQHSTAKFINSASSHLKNVAIRKNINKTQNHYQETTLKTHFATQKDSPQRDVSREQAKQANYRIVKQIRRSRYDKTKTAFPSRQNINAVPLYLNNRLNSKMKKSRAQKTEYSKCSGSQLSNSWVELGIEGRVILESSHQLHILQQRVLTLWQHYQLLTSILLELKEGERQEKNSIVRYVEDVCSQKFQFVRELINSIQKENPSKSQASFMKRLKKVLIQGKLFQNLSIVYVSLQICLHRQADSHIVNFLGYCCSNVVFLLKFIILCHTLIQPLAFSDHTSNILAVIDEFQHESYRTQIQRMSDLVLRIQHNNEIMGILQHRICSKMGKDFQVTIDSFLKHVDLDVQSKQFMEFSHYIFEFLSFHLARSNIVGQFGFVEMAPSPYLTLPKHKTLVIQPWEVLFAMRGQNTYIRAYSQAFLNEVAKHWNIVYWTDLMPDRIDDLMLKIPQGRVLYRYHCRYENYRFLKLLWRIGCDVDNTIILDREEANFKYDRQMGVELPWHGKSKDCRLVEVLNLLSPLLASSIPLRKSFSGVKEQLINLEKKSRHRRRVVIKSGHQNSNKKPEGESMYPNLLFGK